MPVFNAASAPSSVAASSSKLIPGRSVALKYEEDLWHEAVLLAPAPDKEGTAMGWTWQILTPDGDEYAEALDGSAPGPVSCMVLDNYGTAPPNLARRFYRFRNYPDDDTLLGSMKAFLKSAGADGFTGEVTKYLDATGEVKDVPA
eukprot:3575937-Lingulodinium_polyedra.AAC.1